MLLWYASYGSNLLRSRFMCYIEGGKPEGAARTYPGCTVNKPPVKDEQIIIPHELYFSKNSPIWENRAVAFIKSRRDENARILGRMYLITGEQFSQVVRQENSKPPDDTSIEIDFDKTISRGESFIDPMWYGRILYLGERDGYPILTFSAKWSDDEVVPDAPGEKYLRVIIKGIKEIYGVQVDIFGYLSNLMGVKGKISEPGLKDIIRNSI